MPDISLKLSDFRVPVLLIGALLTGFFLGGGPSSDMHTAGLAEPLRHLSLTPEEEVSGGLERSLRPKARPATIGLKLNLPVTRMGEVACLEQGHKLNGAPITYLSQVCMWYNGIDTARFPDFCGTREPGVDGGRMIYTVGCLIREGYWRSAEAAK